jgi:hypothetical protein
VLLEKQLAWMDVVELRQLKQPEEAKAKLLGAGAVPLLVTLIVQDGSRSRQLSDVAIVRSLLWC